MRGLPRDVHTLKRAELSGNCELYRRDIPASAGNPDLQSRLASAVTHPRPGWGNFAPGPPESDLSLDDRTAVVAWILSNFQQQKDVSEGAGK